MEQDNLAAYRAMTPGERLALALELSEFCWQWLDIPDRATGDHKLAAWQREHDLSNETMLRELMRRDQPDRS